MDWIVSASSTFKSSFQNWVDEKTAPKKILVVACTGGTIYVLYKILVKPFFSPLNHVMTQSLRTFNS